MQWKSVTGTMQNNFSCRCESVGLLNVNKLLKMFSTVVFNPKLCQKSKQQQECSWNRSVWQDIVVPEEEVLKKISVLFDAALSSTVREVKDHKVKQRVPKTSTFPQPCTVHSKYHSSTWSHNKNSTFIDDSAAQLLLNTEYLTINVETESLSARFLRAGFWSLMDSDLMVSIDRMPS